MTRLKPKKLRSLSKVRDYDYAEADSIKRTSDLCSGCDLSRGQQILQEAQQYYLAMERFRQDRERNKRYNFGDQWSDMICYDGKRMPESEYIARQGSIPLKNNLIRRLVRNVIGVFSQQATEPTCHARDREEQQIAEQMSTVLQYNMQLNCMSEVYARSMEEFLISGLVVHRKWYGWRDNKMDCWTDRVQPNNFFIDNNMRDERGFDCSLVGEIHDQPFEAVAQKFSHSQADYNRLTEIYRVARNHTALTHLWGDFGFSRDAISVDFLTPKDHNLCRVIEVWRTETKPRWRCHDYNTGEIYKVDAEDYKALVLAENARRMAQGLEAGMAPDDIPLIKAEWYVDSYWYYYYLSPQGDILEEGETPYHHKSHPYVFKAYPFIDGEIHSFVADVIDQQRYTNRLITLYDWIMRASAKGVLLIPEDCVPQGSSPEEFAEAWTRFNGVIVYKAKAGVPAPSQVSANSTQIGIYELLNIQLKMFEDISGVNGALQGKPGYSGMSAALYNQQTQNATTSLLDILDTFQGFIRSCAYKDVKNIQQYYDDKRMAEIAGNIESETPVDPDKIRDVEFDLSIVPSAATPAYRAMANDFLMEMWRAQAISFEQLLKIGDFPFADKLLQSIQSQREQVDNGQMPDGIAPQVLQEAQQQIAPKVNQAAAQQLGRALQG